MNSCSDGFGNIARRAARGQSGRRERRCTSCRRPGHEDRCGGGTASLPRRHQGGVGGRRVCVAQPPACVPGQGNGRRRRVRDRRSHQPAVVPGRERGADRAVRAHLPRGPARGGRGQYCALSPSHGGRVRRRDAGRAWRALRGRHGALRSLGQGSRRAGACVARRRVPHRVRIAHQSLPQDPAGDGRRLRSLRCTRVQGAQGQGRRRDAVQGLEPRALAGRARKARCGARGHAPRGVRGCRCEPGLGEPGVDGGDAAGLFALRQPVDRTTASLCGHRGRNPRAGPRRACR